MTFADEFIDVAGTPRLAGRRRRFGSGRTLSDGMQQSAWRQIDRHTPATRASGPSSAALVSNVAGALVIDAKHLGAGTFLPTVGILGHAGVGPGCGRHRSCAAAAAPRRRTGSEQEAADAGLRAMVAGQHIDMAISSHAARSRRNLQHRAAPLRGLRPWRRSPRSRFRGFRGKRSEQPPRRSGCRCDVLGTAVSVSSSRFRKALSSRTTIVADAAAGHPRRATTSIDNQGSVDQGRKERPLPMSNLHPNAREWRRGVAGPVQPECRSHPGTAPYFDPCLPRIASISCVTSIPLDQAQHLLEVAASPPNQTRNRVSGMRSALGQVQCVAQASPPGCGPSSAVLASATCQHWVPSALMGEGKMQVEPLILLDEMRRSRPPA